MKANAIPGKGKDLDDYPEFRKIRDEIVELKSPEVGGLYFTRDYEWPWAVTNANLEEGLKVLEIGCCYSPFSIYLSKQGLKVTATDKEDYSDIFKDTAVEFVQVAEETKIPFKDKSFDRIFSISVLDHVPEEKIKAMVKEIKRVLKPKGMIIFTIDRANSCRKKGFPDNYIELMMAGLTKTAQANLCKNSVYACATIKKK